MSYVDMAVGLGFFLFFMAMVLMLTIQHFAKVPATMNIKEYREAARDMFESFFEKEGSPSDWAEKGTKPSELGLKTMVYRTPIKVTEGGVSERTDEPIIVDVEFDTECEKDIWNDSVRVYDSSLNESAYEFINPTMCSGQFINHSYVKFNVNVSKNDYKIYYLYYLNDSDIGPPNKTITYNTSSWVPNNGDDWTESTSSWTRYGGSSGTVQTSTESMTNGNSVEISGTFDNTKLGLKYQPPSPETGMDIGWYIDSWLYVDDLNGLSSLEITINNGTNTITSTINTNDMDSTEWYHLERNITSSEWDNWNDMNITGGIESISIYMKNSTSGITRNLKIDELHFELEPLGVTTFPEKRDSVVSRKKVSALNSMSYEEIKDVIGSDYRFRIEIVE